MFFLILSVLFRIAPSLASWLFKLFGHSIDKTASLGLTFAFNSKIVLGQNARLGYGNVINNCRLIINNKGSVGSFNYLHGLSMKHAEYYPDFRNEIILKEEAHITSFHLIDASGGLIVGESSIIAGYRSTLFTHQQRPDNSFDMGAIRIGRNCFIGSNATVFNGVEIEESVYVGAGALILANSNLEKEFIYVGRPAKKVKKNIY